MKRLIAIALFTTSVAAADDRPRHYDFDDDHVEGDVARANEPVIDAVRHRKRDSLIRVRAHFVNELVASARDR